MNLYEQLKNQLTPKHVTERYGPPIHRGNMICCPFHDDRTPSMKLYDDHFYCFGCQKSGDVIDLAAQLLRITNHEAAKRLAVDFGICNTARLLQSGIPLLTSRHGSSMRTNKSVISLCLTT